MHSKLPGRVVLLIGNSDVGKTKLVKETGCRGVAGSTFVRQWTTEPSDWHGHAFTIPIDFAAARDKLVGVYRFNECEYGIRPYDLDQALREGTVVLDTRRCAVNTFRELVEHVHVVEVVGAGEWQQPRDHVKVDREDAAISVDVDLVIINNFPDGLHAAALERTAFLSRLSR